MRVIPALLLAALMAGCVSVSPSALREGKPDYSATVKGPMPAAIRCVAVALMDQPSALRTAPVVADYLGVRILRPTGPELWVEFDETDKGIVARGYTAPGITNGELIKAVDACRI